MLLTFPKKGISFILSLTLIFFTPIIFYLQIAEQKNEKKFFRTIYIYVTGVTQARHDARLIPWSFFFVVFGSRVYML